MPEKEKLIENIVSWALLGAWNLLNRTLKVCALYQFLH